MSKGIENIDVRELVDRIRRSLANRVQGQDEALIADLSTYTSCCALANQRLRACLELAKRGQYANVISLAAQNPSLLDLCSDLEFSEVDLLPSVATSLQIAVPERVNASLVEALQDAYLKGSSTGDNCRLLHKLTLARAPIPSRLSIMRQILIQDPNHPFMEADIRQFELAWFKRVAEYCRPHATNGDTEILEMVLDDLRNSGYLETPPKTVFSTVQSLLQKARQVQIPDILAKIQAAYANRSLDEVRILVPQWQQLAEDSGVDPADPQYALAEVTRWLHKALDNEERLSEENQARAGLARSIQSLGVTQVDLEKIYSVAKAHGVVDDLLESQYQSRIADISRRRTTTRISAVTAGIVIVALISLGTFWFAKGSQHQKEVVKLLGELHVLAQAEKYDEVIRRSDDAPREVAADNQIVEVVRRAMESKSQRDLLNKAITAISECSPDGDVQVLVNRAMNLAKTAADKVRVNSVHDTWKESKQKQMHVKRATYEQELGRIAASIDELQKISVWNGVDQQQRIDTLGEQIRKARDFARESGVGEGQLPDLEKRVAKVSSRVIMARMMKSQIERAQELGSAEFSLDEHAKFLSESLAKESREDSLTERLKASAADLTTWKRVQQLQNDLSNRRIPDVTESPGWDGSPLVTLIPILAREIQLAEVRSLRSSSKGESPNETEKLLVRLQAADMKDVQCVRMTGFNCPYYTRSSVPEGEAEGEIEYLTDLRGNTLTTKISGSRKVYSAPQTVYLKKVLPILSPDANWHSAITKAYAELQASEDMDPILKLQLTDRFLSVMTSSSTALSNRLESQPSFKTVFRSSVRVTGQWYVPSQEDKLETTREEATRLSKSTPTLTKEDATAAEQRDNSLADLHRRAVMLLGLAASGGKGGVSVSLFAGTKLPDSGTIYVISNGKWIEVGQIKDGQIQWQPVVEEFIGWPIVYVAKT